MTTDTIPVDVVFSPMDSTQDYHDIKDIIEVKPPEEKKKWWLWYAIGGGALLIVLLLIYLLRKKKPVVTAAAPVIDPYEEAMKQLEKLQTGKAGSEAILFPAGGYFQGICLSGKKTFIPCKKQRMTW